MRNQPELVNLDSESETIAVRAGEEMDWPALTVYLCKHLNDFPNRVSVTQFAGDHANLTYCLSAEDGREWVVRRPPLGPVAKNAHDMSREYRMLPPLHASYDRAPQAHRLCEDETIIGAPFLLVERRWGGVLKRIWPESFKTLTNIESRIAYALVDALADLHLARPQEIGLSGLGRPKGFAARQVKGWEKRWHAAKQKDVMDFEIVHAELSRRIPENSRVAVLHNDFKLDNCMVADGDPDRITTVLDWDMATLGDPLIDLGTFLNYWPLEAGRFSWDKMPPAVSGAYPRRAELIARYADRTDFDVEGTNWYEAFANWKTGIVVQQIYIRHYRGQTDDERFANYSEYAEPLFAAARELLKV